SFDAQLSLNPKLLDSLPQSCPGHAQKLCRMDLVSLCFFQSLNNQLSFDGRDDFQFWLAARPLKELPGEGGDVRVGIVCSWAGGGQDRPLSVDLCRQVAR